MYIRHIYINIYIYVYTHIHVHVDTHKYVCIHGLHVVSSLHQSPWRNVDADGRELSTAVDA